VLLFRDDAYLRDCAARIAGVDERGIRLDRTVFYPQGGGQPGDSGVLKLADGTALKILDTRKGDAQDDIVHVLAEGCAGVTLSAGLVFAVAVEGSGNVVATLGEGNFFGEISLLTSAPRNATVRAKSYCDFFALDKSDFIRVLRDRPQFLKSVMEIAQTRYNVTAEEGLSQE